MVEPQRRREVEAIFRLMDTDQDGYIPVEEAHRLARMLGVVAPENHSVHYKGVSLSQFQGWISSLTKPFNHEEEVVKPFVLNFGRIFYLNPWVAGCTIFYIHARQQGIHDRSPTS